MDGWPPRDLTHRLALTLIREVEASLAKHAEFDRLYPEEPVAVRDRKEARG